MSTPTERVIVPGSEKTLPTRAHPIGAPDPGETLEVTVRLRGKAPIAPRVSAEPLSRERFAEAYGADPADLARVERFASDFQLTVRRENVAQRTVVLVGDLAHMEAAFGVTLKLYELGGVTFRGRSGSITVPSDLAGVVEGVLGLDDRRQAQAHFRLLGSEPDSPVTSIMARVVAAAFGAPEVARLYRFPEAYSGAGQTIALIELGGGYRKADVDAYFRSLNIKPPKLSAVSVLGARNQPTGEANGPDGEVLLDIEVAGATAPGASMAVYFAPNTDQGFVSAVLSALHDARRRPSVISISWGAPESDWTEQSRKIMTEAFRAAAALGVTVLCAAGDNGSGDRPGATDANVDFPASSPFATGCGGTRLLTENGQIKSETVWNNGPGRGATGGGISAAFPLPDYQAGVNVPASVNPGHAPGRGVPDVAGLADPQTGYRILVDGQQQVFGGTSAVAPLWAGLIARLNEALTQAGGENVGFLNPQLYALSGVLRDVTQGGNGAYQAGPGWDPCTGLGSPDGQRLLEALQGVRAG